MSALRRSSVVVSALAAAALLAGCTGGLGGGPADDELSPLEKIFNEMSGADMSPEDQEKMWAEHNKKVEELVAECMQKEGFEYIPNVDNGGVSIGTDVEWKPDDREWVSQWGYGAAKSPGSDDPGGDTIEWVDPNSDYLNGLSESEQNAYWEVLYGPPMEGDTIDVEWSWEQNGCYGWAQHEAEGDSPYAMWESEEADAFYAALETYYTDMQNNEGIRKLDEEWSSCMSGAGYSFAKRDDAQNEIFEELNAYYENLTEWIENDPKIDEIHEKEVALALADLDCREKTDYTKRARTVQFELEEQFIAQHKAEIDALLALAKK